MTLETGNFISDLAPANPTSTDPKSQGDDHLRLLKTVLQDSFNGTGMILVTGTDAGTANNFVVTLATQPGTVSAYSTGMIVMFYAATTNTGASTININAFGAKTLVGANGEALIAGDIAATGLVLARYDGTQFWLITGNNKVGRNGGSITGTLTVTGTINGSPTVVFDDATLGATTATSLAVAGAGSVGGALSVGGTHTSPTPAAGDNSNNVATTAFVAGAIIGLSLPGQTGRDGMVVTSINGAANWYEGVDQARVSLGVI
jgi:hypothetical protein